MKTKSVCMREKIALKLSVKINPDEWVKMCNWNEFLLNKLVAYKRSSRPMQRSARNINALNSLTYVLNCIIFFIISIHPNCVHSIFFMSFSEGSRNLKLYNKKKKFGCLCSFLYFSAKRAEKLFTTFQNGL